MFANSCAPIRVGQAALDRLEKPPRRAVDGRADRGRELLRVPVRHGQPVRGARTPRRRQTTPILTLPRRAGGGNGRGGSADTRGSSRNPYPCVRLQPALIQRKIAFLPPNRPVCVKNVTRDQVVRCEIRYAADQPNFSSDQRISEGLTIE